MLMILLVIVGGIYVKTMQEKKRTEEYDIIDEIALEKTLEPVIVRNNFYIVKNCINRFYSYCIAVSDIGENYYNANKAIIQEAQSQNAEAIYEMLDTEYISSENVTKENILEKLPKIKSSTVNITNMYVSEQTNNISIYIVKGILKENITNKTSPFQIIVKVDSFNKTFSIIPQSYVEKKYNNLQIGDNIQIEVPEEIGKKTNNNYTFAVISDETYVRDLFYQYKVQALYTPTLVYNNLDEEYRNKRFGTLKDLEQYIKNREKMYENIQLDKYQKIVKDDYTQYVCVDKNGNYYIFTEKSVMNYSLILDTYTIDLPEFIEKYNNAEENEKVLLNIQKVFEALNSGDYTYVYNKLDNTFKSNYFKTQAEFEKYVKEKLYTNNKVSYGNYQKGGDVYVYDIQITDANKQKMDVINKKLVMQLKQGTDFVMSFNVE